MPQQNLKPGFTRLFCCQNPCSRANLMLGEHVHFGIRNRKVLSTHTQCNCNLSYWILSFICLWALIWFIMVSRNHNHTVLPWNNDVTGKVNLVFHGSEGKDLILEIENTFLLHCCLVWVSWALPVTLPVYKNCKFPRLLLKDKQNLAVSGFKCILFTGELPAVALKCLL